MLVRQLEQVGHENRQSVSARLQPSRHRLFSPSQSRRGTDGAGDDLGAALRTGSLGTDGARAGNNADAGTTTYFAVPAPVKLPLVGASLLSAASVIERFNVPRGSIWSVPEYGW